jgi:uncharacterized Zn finger protein
MADSSLSRSDVRNWTEQRFYDRGETYFQEDRIQRPRREGRTLKAECQGSQPSPYHVEATLDNDGIVEAVCSCPMGEGGYCKHVVALLLTWVEAPEDFSELEPLEETLQNRSKEKLVELILTMVDRHPELDQIVSVSTQARTNLDVEGLRQEIESVFDDKMGAHPGRGQHYNWHYASTTIASDLKPFLNLGDDYADQGRPADAATVYRLLAEAGCDHYRDLPDGDGKLAGFVRTCTERLGDLLATTDDPDLRERILRALFHTYEKDLDLGGHGLGDAADTIILDQATPDEREQVANWVRDRLPEHGLGGGPAPSVFVLSDHEEPSWSSSWKLETLGRFLVDLLADTLDDEEYLRICRQTGRVTELVDRLLADDRLDEALDAAREASDEEVYQLKSTFAEHGVEDALYDLALDGLGDDPHLQLLTWVRNYAQEHGDLDRALRLSKRLFWTHTNVDAYERLRTVARHPDRWDAVQAEIHDQLREQDDYGLLTRLHLANDNIEAALEILPKADASFSWSYDRSPLPIAVAEAAEDEYPDEAIRIYTERGRSLIAERGRDNYQDAAELFQRVKALYDRTQPGAWDDVLEALYDDELHRLPAARDEFEKADLL